MWLYLLAPLANKFFEADPKRNKLVVLFWLICSTVPFHPEWAAATTLLTGS